jgi:hypothetical protein
MQEMEDDLKDLRSRAYIEGCCHLEELNGVHTMKCVYGICLESISFEHCEWGKCQNHFSSHKNHPTEDARNNLFLHTTNEVLCNRIL